MECADRRPRTARRLFKRSNTGKPAPKSSAAPTVARELVSGHFDAIASRLEPPPPLSVDAQTIRAEWDHVVEAYGPYKSTGQGVQSGDVATVPLTMGRGQVTLAVATHPDGHLFGVGFEATTGANPPSLTEGFLAPKAVAESRALIAGDTAAALQEFDPLLRAELSGTALGAALPVRALFGAYGAYRSLGQPLFVGVGTYGIVVDVPVDTAIGLQPYVQVSFDGNGQVSLVDLLPPGPQSKELVGIGIPPSIAAASVASAVANLLHDADYSSVIAEYDPLGAASAPKDQLVERWTTITKGFGPLKETTDPALMGSTPAGVTYEVGMSFEGGAAHAQVTVDRDNRVEGLVLLAGAPTRQFGR